MASQEIVRSVDLASTAIYLHIDASHLPDFGQGDVADETRDLGTELITIAQATFALDIEPYAPQGWDGRVWLSVGTDWVCASRSLELQILASNENVAGEFLVGTDPSAFGEAYARPRVLEGDTRMVEMTIPLEGLGVETPEPGDEWRLSLCRGRSPGRANPDFELIVCAPLQSGGFNDLANFGSMIFR